MAIQFITGNRDKFEEAKVLLGIPLAQRDFNLPEIQELDAKEIIRQKLFVAEAHSKGQYIVEDTALYFDCLGGQLPGPFIKWFLKSIGNKEMAELVEKYGVRGATAHTYIGYADEFGKIHFFEGMLRGNVVRPRGDKDFGWGPIFEPEGYTKTFGEMDRAEKHKISMRSIAFTKLKEFLVQNSAERTILDLSFIK